MIDDVLLFLEGKTLDVRSRLRERMQKASNQLDFERAAQLRDALQWLEQVERSPTVERVGGGDADVIGLARDGDDACGVILRIRDGRLIAREHRFLERAERRDGGDGPGRLPRAILSAARGARGPSVAAVRSRRPGGAACVVARGRLARPAARHQRQARGAGRAERPAPAREPVARVVRRRRAGRRPRVRAGSRSRAWRACRAPSCASTSPPTRAGTRSDRWSGSRRDAPRRPNTGASGSRGRQQDDFAAVHEVVSRFVRRRLDEQQAAARPGRRGRRARGSCAAARGGRGGGGSGRSADS